MYLRESMAEDQEADAAEEEAEEEEAGRFRWFRLEAQRRALSESAWRQRARVKEPGSGLLQMGLLLNENPFRALRAHQIPDFTVAHRMITKAAYANLDVRRKSKPKIMAAHSLHEIEKDDNSPRPVKLPSLYDEDVELTTLMSDGLRDAMHHARVINAEKRKNVVDTNLLPPECYDLEELDPEALQTIKAEMMAQQNSLFAKEQPRATQRLSPVRSPKALDHAGRTADTGNEGGPRQVEQASKSATCHWCRQAKKWCGWCTVPDILFHHRSGGYLSEGFHSHERRPHKGNEHGLLGDLGVGGKSVGGPIIIKRTASQAGNSKNPQTTGKGQRPAQNGKDRSVSSLGRLEGHGHGGLTRKKGAKRKKKQKGGATDEEEEERKKVLQILQERKPICFGLFEDAELEQLSHRVTVRQIAAGELVMKYGEDCCPQVVALPDTEDGRPVMAMSSEFFIVMYGMLNVFSEYSDKKQPVLEGKATRGCVFGELSAVLGGRRGCTIRAAMACGVIQVRRSDITLLISKKLTDLAMADDLARQRELEEKLKMRQLEELAIFRQPILAALAVKKRQTEAMVMQNAEREVFGQALNDDLARAREWKTGSQARNLKKSYDLQMKDICVRKLQQRARIMLARLRAQRQRQDNIRRLAKAITLQRTLRGHLGRRFFASVRQKIPGLKWEEIRAENREAIRVLVRSAVEIKNDALAAALQRQREFGKVELDAFHVAKLSHGCYVTVDGKYLKPAAECRGLTTQDFALVRERRLAEKDLFLRKEEIHRQTELLMQAERHCCEEIFQSLEESVNTQRLSQLKALLNGIKIGTVFGFSFLTVSEEIRVPLKALNRWIGGDIIIKKKKQNESAEQLEERIQRMIQVIHEKVLAWFHRMPQVQGLVLAWKDDVQLPLAMVAQGHETRGAQLARQIPGFENMKSLKDIFQAAKVLKSMSTRMERQAKEDFHADMRRRALADGSNQASAVGLPDHHTDETQTVVTVRRDVLSSTPDPVSGGGGGGGAAADYGEAGGNETSFSLANFINDCADNQEDLSLPDISLDSSLAEISEVEAHPSTTSACLNPLDADDEGETEESKALLSMTAAEANRLVKCRRRLLLEYAHKIELGQINKGIDAGYLFKSLDSDCDGLLSAEDLRRGLRALQVHIDNKSLEELTIALGRDRLGQFPLRRLLDQIFLRRRDIVTPQDSPRLHSEGASFDSANGASPVKDAKDTRPSLSFSGRDGDSGALEREAEDIHSVQNAMVLLYAVINPESAENRKAQASAEKILETLALLAGKTKKKKKKSHIKWGSKKIKNPVKALRGPEKPETFSCKRGCGFLGEFDPVATHEETCRYVRGDIAGAAEEMLDIKHPFRDRVRTCVLNEIISLIPAPTDNDLAPYRSNVRVSCMMRALHDGKWDQLVDAILHWHQPILSTEFIQRNIAQIDRLTSLLTSVELEDATARVHKFHKVLQCRSFFFEYPESDHRLLKLREEGSLDPLAPWAEAMVSRIRALVNDVDLLSHSAPSQDTIESPAPRLNGTEGVAEWVEYNKLYDKLARLRGFAADMLLDRTRAHTLESDKGQVYRRQMHEAASMLRTMKDFAFDISGIYHSKETSRQQPARNLRAV